MAQQVDQEACPECQSQGRDQKGDNLKVFEDDSKHCFSCGHHVFPDGESKQSVPAHHDLPPPGEFQSLPDRRITEETCRYYRYTVDAVGNQLAYYRKGGEWVFASKRTPDKDFPGYGPRQGVELFGQYLFQPVGEKSRLTITEGELDTLAAFQMLRNGKYINPVVSICGGVQNAANNVRDNYEWICKFQTIILAFDSDEPGQKAAKEVAEMLPPGRVKIMNYQQGLKDAGDYLKGGREEQFITDWWAAKDYVSDTIVHVSQVSRDRGDEEVYTFADRDLTRHLIGKESGELIVFGSGSGMGKSTQARGEILHDLEQGLNVGVIMLEESTQDTKDELAGIILGKPVRKILGQRKLLKIDPTLKFEIEDNLTDEELDRTLDAIEQMPLYMRKHDGNLDSKNLVNKIRHFAVGCGCQIVYLDHISLVVAGGKGDERQDIDRLMKELVSVKEETGVIIVLVSQFSTPDGKSYEEGAVTHLNSFRGSRAIGHAADIAIGLERNQQAETEEDKSKVTIRSLKARRSGYTGKLTTKYYNKKTGRFMDQWRPEPPFVNQAQEAEILGSVE